MKKIYLLSILFLSIFSYSRNLDLFASGLKINSPTYYLTASKSIHRVNPNSEANYKGNLTVANPTSSPTASSTSICEGSSLTLTANPAGGVAPYTFSWTGPNSYASTAENPVINNVTTSNTGTYSLVVTDANGAASTAQSTAAVVVNTKVDPTFDAILPAICSGGSAPVLSTLSTNGITGTWNPSVVSNTATATYLFTPNAGQCANSFSLTIFVIKNVTPTFTLPASICQGTTSPILSNTSNNGITGTWNPSTVSNTASGSYIFTPSGGQCATTVTINITVNPIVTPTFDPIAPICENATAPVLPTTSTNGITGTWSPAVSNTASGTYTFTPNAGQCAASASLTVTVNPNIIPTFTAIAPICWGATSPVLPTTSNNGFTGTWSPATVSNTASGTYTFTPTAGQCALTTTLSVTVTPNVTPTFNPIADVCYGSTAPTLPTTSTNGITGTWNPATVSNKASAIYTFTPNAGPCATTTTLNINVNTIIPSFNVIAPICANTTAPILPTTSTNGITGTWSPATVSNTASGTYTFTPNAGQCAVTASITVTVNPNITPTFNPIAAVCYGSTAPTLQTTSNNGFTGTWNPATVSNTASGTYTFTPTAGQCATITTLTINVNSITPTFNAIADVCYGLTAPTLSTTSTNAITGNWNPATVSNTASGTYTFTPDAGQCAITVAISINVNTITPIFNAIAPICANATAPILPTTSTNAITGTWSPAIVSNTTSGTYTFTPNAGQCALTTTLNITVNPNVTPTFDPIADVCYGSKSPILPTISNNGITGTWNPATVSNTASATYTFTPSAGLCATTATLSVVVNTITPSFNFIAPICKNATAPILPTTSVNVITGTWSPATVSNTASGTYTFTPDPGQCAVTASITITVNPNITPTFDPIAAVCYGSTAPSLLTTSNNGFTGTWNPATVSNTASAVYTFTPDAGQCATTTTLNINVNTITPSFNAIAPICENATAPTLSSTSTNGITGTWNPATVSNTASGTYTFTPDTNQCALTTTLSVTVTPNVTPTFTAIAPICSGATSPVLPTTSNNGYTGTWNPATVDNTTSATYTFTPNAGQCALTTTLSVTVTPNVTPTFTAIAPICSGATSPILPTSSNNGHTGTWSPATVSNTTSGTYTFTPTAGQCALITTLNVTVTPNVIPAFNPIADVCYGSTAPTLPTTSNNGITGTWNPAIVSNTASAIYTFTPDAGPCATTATLSINVTIITPSFNAIAPICENTTAPILTSPSINGITGTWNPVTISNTASGTYTFTPDPGQCAKTTSLNVTVNPYVAPSFTTIAPICSGATSPVLSTTSNNGYTGTWSPATVSNTTSATYTFTPDLGQCTFATTMSVTVNPNVTPTFTAIAPICSGTTSPVLPTTSINGIIGTWSPANVSNTTSGTYTFNPTVGLCALPITLSVTVYPSPTAIVLTTTDVVNEGPDGIIVINSVTSGLAPYQYSINNSGFTTITTYANLLPGNYTITVKDSNGCEFSKVATINSICLFPNAISPNGDNINDTFNLKGCNIVKLELFNRYGRKINTFSNYTDQWDGTTSGGDALPDGTYYYVAEDNSGKVNTGWVFIAR